MNILITGGSGLIGSAVVEHFVNEGHTIFSLQRNKSNETEGFWNFDRLNEYGADTSIDVVIHLAGENIAAGRWTKRKKALILESRVKGTNELVSFLSSQDQKPKLFLCASAIGYYGNRGDTVLIESSETGDNFVAEVCRKWEQAAKGAEKSGIRVVSARIGMVLSGQGGTLDTMLPSFKLGIAGIVGSGKQFVSWVDIRDIVSMIQFVIEETTISGPVNFVSPHPATNREFTKTLGRILNRPTVMKMPAFAAKAVFGQMGSELVLSSTRVIPKLLLDKGYNFVSPNLEESLSYCLDQ